MYYLIRALDAPGKQSDRQAARPAHLQRLQALRDAGRLLTAGPIPAIDSSELALAGVKGSLIVAEFEHLAAARQWAADDPYQAAGVYAEVEIEPFVAVFK